MIIEQNLLYYVLRHLSELHRLWKEKSVQRRKKETQQINLQPYKIVEIGENETTLVSLYVSERDKENMHNLRALRQLL